MEERILTSHPQREKRGVSIGKDKYDLVRAAIIECLQGRELTFTDLTRQVEQALKGRFRGSIPWYVETVKLDLEARGIIARVPKTRPQRYRLTGSAD